MDEKSTTANENNQESESQATDQQTASDSNNLDTSNQDQNQSNDANNDDSADKGNDTPATFDDDLDEWMEKRKLPKAKNDEEKQAYQDLRNSQREFTREQQAKKDANALNKDLQSQREEFTQNNEDDENDDELEKTVKELKADRDQERTTRLQSEFYTENKVSDAEHKAILDIIKEKVARATSNDGKLKALDIWGGTDALPDLLDLAKARLSKSTDPSLAEETAAKAERERIAKESNANSNTRSAKTVTTGDKTPEQERLERFSKW